MFYGGSFESAAAFIEELERYIHYYNNERLSVTLKGMSPVQYRTHSHAIKYLILSDFLEALHLNVLFFDGFFISSITPFRIRFAARMASDTNAADSRSICASN